MEGQVKSVYHAKGHILVQWIEFCDCCYCEGHEQEEDVELDKTYLADDEGEAKWMLGQEYRRRYDVEGDGEVYIGFLEDFVIYNVEEHPDRIMRMAGYATLPGMD